MSNPLPDRIVAAWKRSVNAGHSLTPGQFLVLCHIVTARHDPPSAKRCAQHLRMSQPMVSGAQHALAQAGLVTLKSYPTISRFHCRRAKPTTAAMRLFNPRHHEPK